MSVLIVIPARGGSKGIPRKNVKVLNGKPLIAWTIESARKSQMASEVIVSTDDPETAAIAEAWGARVPFMRPAEFARDDTPGIETAVHAAEVLPEYEWVLLAQPTSPLRIAEDFDGIIRECAAAGARAAVSVVETSEPPEWTFARTESGYFVINEEAQTPSRRQDLPVRYSLKGGGLYLAQRDWLLRNHSYVTPKTYMFVMPRERCVDIDSRWEWELVEALMGHFGVEAGDQ